MAAPRHDIRWTEALVGRLKALAAQDITQRQISAAMGIGEKAINKKMWRLGLNKTVHFDWTPEHLERLKALCADGLSSGQIAKELGLSRGAVCGKLSRLRLQGQQIPWNRPVRKIITPHKEPKLKLRPMTFAPPLPKPKPQLVCKPCSFMKLRAGRCHWPLWDDPTPPFYDQRYCGGASGAGPYCAYHSAMAYRSPSDRRLDRMANQD